MLISNKKTLILISSLFVVNTIICFPQIFYKNQNKSTSIGKVNSGEIKNAWLLPRKGENYKYFSPFSYYVLGRAYTHSDIYNSVIETYDILLTKCPDKKFRYMECSKKKGGRIRPHRTHQNGMSVDFMTPLRKGNKQKLFYDRIGMFRYIMNFDKNGKAKINEKVQIDFELVALHILILDKTAGKHKLKIKKVIFNTFIQDELFDTKYGAELKKRSIYFTKNLSPMLNKLHDDHYHIDFEAIH